MTITFALTQTIHISVLENPVSQFQKGLILMGDIDVHITLCNSRWEQVEKLLQSMIFALSDKTKYILISRYMLVILPWSYRL